MRTALSGTSKESFKLIQYMAAGLPVIASPVGMNSILVEHRINGFLAAGDAEWFEALEARTRDPQLRHTMGTNGRMRIEREYSLQCTIDRLVDLLTDVGRNR